MVPRVGRQGKSFKGAAAYYLHDKDADTSLRVEHTETRNLPTDDPELGWRVMAATAKDSDRLKREAGVDRRGRKLTKPVFHLSVSWHPEERPSHEHMVQTMDSALAALGLEKHQAVYAIHGDEPHRHIHAFVNLVNPENGRSNSVRYSKRVLSKWAEGYEREHGIRCEQRVINNQRRAEGKAARQTTSDHLRGDITAAYRQSDSGTSFVAALKKQGYAIAQGRRLVVIDQQGQPHALFRQIDGVPAAEIKARLKGIAFPALQERSEQDSDTRERAAASGRTPRSAAKPKAKEDLPYFDRDRQARESDERIIDAGIRHGNAQARREAQAQRRSDLLRELQDRHIQERGQLSERHAQARHLLDGRLAAQYGDDTVRLQREIKSLERGLTRRFVLNRAEKEHALEQARRSVGTIEQRRQEAVGALGSQVERDRQAFEERAEYEKLIVESGFSSPTARSSPAVTQAPDATSPKPSLGETFALAADAKEERRAAYMERSASTQESRGENRPGPTQI